jgi:hypothetical protein
MAPPTGGVLVSRQRIVFADPLEQTVMLVLEPAIGAQASGEQHHQRSATVGTIEIRHQALLLTQLADCFMQPRFHVGQLREMRLHEFPRLRY